MKMCFFNKKYHNNSFEWLTFVNTETLAVDTVVEVDRLESLNIPSNLLTILGKSVSAHQTANDRRIVLYVLSADDEHSDEKEVLTQLYDEFSEYCACRGFELQLCDLHSTRLNFMDPQSWTNGPAEARAGHHLEAECLATITSNVISELCYLQ